MTLRSGPQAALAEAAPDLADGIPVSLTKSAAAYQALRTWIEGGRLRPGDRLRVDMLRLQLGMSSTPVREALRLLQAEGLVEYEAHRGLSVRTYTQETIDEIYRLREVLEPLATEAAAELMTAAELTAVRQVQDQLARDSSSASTAVRAAHLNAEWHRMIYAASGSRYLIEFITRLWAAIPVEALWVSTSAEKSLARHQAILAALEAHDSRLAASLMRKHIQGSWERLRRRAGT
jgi:DNA-binding GntR family transcriptional regulator